MENFYTKYLQIIKNTITQSTSSISLSLEEQTKITSLAQRHFSGPFLLSYITEPSCLSILNRQTKQLMLNYYQIEHFTQQVVSLFEENNIPYFLLKGISLASYYPMSEYRKLGDVDIYINNPKALALAKKVLEENGFVDTGELSDHHITYHYTTSAISRVYILELHFRVVGLYQYKPANKIVDLVYQQDNVTRVPQVIHGKTYFVLSPTKYTFYMIHHMLKHYLYNGFGIRLLCDFTLYLNANYKQINFDKLHNWCQKSRILHLYEIIIQVCRTYLGLSECIDSSIIYSEEKCEQFILHVLKEEDMGGNDSSTLVGSGSYEKVNLFTYIKEGHLQMRVRFPKLGKYPFLWPILWSITLFYFLKNTYFLRKTTLRDTLHSFSAKNQASKLIQIFDNSDL